MSKGLQYKYRGARAMVFLHAEEMREFLKTWKQFKASGAALPETDDSDYQSPETVLRHVLRAARGYMTWMCKVLELPDPQIEATPEADQIEAEADAYLEHLLEQWAKPLASVPEAKFGDTQYQARWGMEYYIDSMMEHAVLHPMRHTFQLTELMERTQRL